MRRDIEALAALIHVPESMIADVGGIGNNASRLLAGGAVDGVRGGLRSEGGCTAVRSTARGAAEGEDARGDAVGLSEAGWGGIGVGCE